MIKWVIAGVFLPLIASGAELPALPAQVHAIFEAKCVECHGAELPHPKGHFGYVLDLARVAANPKMIVPGSPANSELYQLVLDDEMPGNKAKSPPLTPPEKDIVKAWIAIGAPRETAAAPAAALVEPKPPTLTFWQRCIRFLGQFHPPSAHFPIALLLAAAPAECMWMRTRDRSWKAIVRFCAILGAVSGVMTATLGWCDAAFSNYTSESAAILAWHRWVGTAVALLAVLSAILCEVSHNDEMLRARRYWFRAVLAISVVTVGAAGFLGASLIYGLDHFRW